MASVFGMKRLARELPKLQNSLPPGIELVSASDFSEWLMDIRVLDPSHPIYAGAVYRLRFRFASNYPIEAPEVMFVTAPAAAGPPSDLSATTTTTTTTSTTTTTPRDGLPRNIPIHPHIYSNGIICLDLLDKAGWSPVNNVESICMSLQSMLAGNFRNERPEGDEMFVRTNRSRPKDILFEFHDQTC